jgi:hypothetical protein
MSKRRKYPMRTALEAGQSYTWTIPDGGDLASMRKALRHGQTLTIAPVRDPAEIQVGDKVLVEWRGSDIFHLVGDIRDGRYLIVNSLGGENGWVEPGDILGRVIEVVEPEPRPEIPELQELFQSACERLIEEEQAAQQDDRRLRSVIEDMRWYAERLGPERWDEMPRSNKWSFHQNLWWLTKKVRQGEAPVPDRLSYFIDKGKQIVGEAAAILTLLDYGDIYS